MDVASEGRFLINTVLERPEADTGGRPTALIVVQHWDEELKRLVPAK